jgi:GxxExxY protein
MNEEEIVSKIIGQAIEVHKTLGPGLLESSYKEYLVYKLRQTGLFVEKEKAMPLVIEEVKLECGYRIDILVNKRVVVELKSVEALNDVHMAQVLTYMKLGNFNLGLLFNFNVTLLKNGMKRLKNGYSGIDFKNKGHKEIS